MPKSIPTKKVHTKVLGFAKNRRCYHPVCFSYPPALANKKNRSSLLESLCFLCHTSKYYLCHTKPNPCKVQHNGQAKDKIKRSMFCFMMFLEHRKKTPDTAAQKRHQKQRFFRDSSFVFDCMLLIYCHGYIKHNVDCQIIQNTNPKQYLLQF